MTYHIVFDCLLLLSCGFALARGTRDGRIVALICLCATFASRLLIHPAAFRYSGVELGVVLVDALTFAGFTFVALQSSRFWPMWVAGLQLATLAAHLMKGLEGTLMPLVYAAASRAWSYPILIILTIGTLRAHHRHLAAIRDSHAEPMPR